MAFQFRYRKFCNRVLEIIRELFIGKMAGVIVAWMLKNAVFFTIIITKAGTLGKDPRTLLEPEYASSHSLDLLLYSCSTFVILLLFAALLAYLVTQGSWSGFMQQSIFQQGPDEAGGLSRRLQLQAHASGLLDIRETSQVFTEMSNFYVSGLVFIPAWAYKDLIDRSREFFTIHYNESVIDAVENATDNFANRTGTFADSFGFDRVISAGVGVITTGVDGITNITSAGVDVITNMTGVDGDASDNAESNDGVFEEFGNESNATNASDLEIVVKGQEILEEFQDPITLWNVFCFLVATCGAATLQVIAHTAVDKLQGGRWDYLKQVFKSLETCMGLGTGAAFWAVVVGIFEDSAFSWPLRSLYTIFITAVCVGTQLVLRSWLARHSNLNTFCVGGVKFIDKAYDFVIAWAWQAWLIGTFKPGLDSLLGDSDDACAPFYKTHHFMRASQITFLCIAVNALLDVFREHLKVTPEIRQTALLITGVNAGWAWMFFARSWFECGGDIQYNVFKLWGLSSAVIAGTLACVFMLDYLDHRVESYVQDLRKQAGTLDDKDDESLWRQYDSSEGSDSSDEDEDSDDDFEDHGKPARPTD